MPANKEALVRYRAINRCLVDYRIASKDVLIDACTSAIGTYVSWRTIANDIKTMRFDEQLGYLAPIKTIKGEGYAYEDPNYSIDSIPLKKEELTAIAFAANLLKQYSQVDLFSTFSGAVEKLSDKVELHVKENDTTKLGNVISFEKSYVDGGSEFINELLQHIRQKTVVQVMYHSFSTNSKKTHTIHPYFLKEYRNRWYIVGYHQEYQEVRTLALERINSVSPEYSVSYQPATFNIHSYYENAVGVSITSDKPQTILLELDAREYQYFETQPIHPSQKVVVKSDDKVQISLYVILNYELKSTLLSMGSKIKVLEPVVLRDHILNEANNMIDHYNS